MNVALTRAKYGLVVMGNPKVLSKRSVLWNNLLHHFQQQDLLVEGSLEALKVASNVQLRNPVRYRADDDDFASNMEKRRRRRRNNSEDDRVWENGGYGGRGRPMGDSRHDPRFERQQQGGGAGGAGGGYGYAGGYGGYADDYGAHYSHYGAQHRAYDEYGAGAGAGRGRGGGRYDYDEYGQPGGGGDSGGRGGFPRDDYTAGY